MVRTWIVLVALLSVTGGCKKKRHRDRFAQFGSDGVVELPLLKLRLDLRTTREMISGGLWDGDGMGLSGADVGAMRIEVAKTVQSFEDARDQARTLRARNLQAAELPDGWSLVYDLGSSTGVSYVVQVRRDLGGKTYLCSTLATDPHQANVVAEACRTLRPARSDR